MSRRDPVTAQRAVLVMWPLAAAMFAGLAVDGDRAGVIAAHAAFGFGITLVSLVVVFEIIALAQGLRLPAFVPRPPLFTISPAVAEYMPKTIWVIRNREPVLVDRFLRQGPLLDPAFVWDTFFLSLSVVGALLGDMDDHGLTDDDIVTECVALAPLLPVPIAEDDFATLLGHFRRRRPLPMTSLSDVTLPVLCTILTLAAASASLLHLNRRQLDSRLLRVTVSHQQLKKLARKRPATPERRTSDTVATRSPGLQQLGPRTPIGSTQNEHAGAPQFLWSDLLRLALANGDGRIQHRGILAQAARGALLIDLVHHGLITCDDDGLHYDTSTTTIPLADILIADVEHHPHRTLAELMQRGRPHLDAFTDLLISDGVWTRPRPAQRVLNHHLIDRDAQTYSDAAETLAEIAAARIPPVDPHHAILAALAVVLNLTAGSHRQLNPAPEVLLTATGDLSWIVRDVTSHLYNAQLLDQSAAAADNTASTTTLGSA